MTLIQREAPSHWYSRAGEPMHEIPKKDGTGNRPVTLADARKTLLLPSVTNVLGVLAKPGLDAWKIEQGIMAALTLPRIPFEPLDAFAHRVVADMGEQVEKAADFGTAIHNACEVYSINKELPTDPKLRAHLEGWRQWFDRDVERIAAIETVFVNHEHGYAGRVDMVAKLRGIGWAVVDFKTQKMKRTAKGGAKPTFYETWPLQLEAYRQAILCSHAKDITALVSVVINSVEPGPAFVRVWNSECGVRSAGGTSRHLTPALSPNEAEREGKCQALAEDGKWEIGEKAETLKTEMLKSEGKQDYFGAFLAALRLWKYVKGYDPVAQDHGTSPEIGDQPTPHPTLSPNEAERSLEVRDARRAV